VKSKPTVEAIRYAWYATLYAKSLGKAVIHTIFNDDNLEKSLDVADKLREKLWKAAADFKASSFLNSGYSPSDSPNSGEVVSVNTNAWGSIPKGDRIANTGHTAYGLKPFNKMEEEKRKKQPKTFGALPNWPPPSLLKRQSFGYGGAQKKQTRKRRQALAHTRRGRGRA
jgi:hypothetical protein